MAVWLAARMAGALVAGLAVATPAARAAPALQLQCPPSALPQQPFDCQVLMNLNPAVAWPR